MSSGKVNIRAVLKVQKSLEHNNQYNRDTIEKLRVIVANSLKETKSWMFLKKHTLQQKLDALDYLLKNNFS